MNRWLKWMGRALVLGVAASAGAGDLNPPAGPVQPTMRTLDEVFAAASMGGGADACGEAVPGLARGVCIMSSPVLPIMSPVYEVEFTLTRPVAQGGTLGPLQADPVTFVKDLDQNSPIILQRLAVGSAAQSLTLNYYDASNVNYYKLVFQDVRFVAAEQKVIERCDGSFAHVEQVAIVWAQATLTDIISGQSYTVQLVQGP